MKATISNSLLAKLEPRSAAYDIWDDKLTGFILRVQPTGSMVYRCEYARGKRVKVGYSSVITPAQARDMAKEALGKVALGIKPGTNKARDPLTLREYVENEYQAWRLANRKSGKDDLYRLKVNFVKQLGNRLLEEITPITIEKWRTKRINAGTQAATVSRDIIILKSALAKAVEWGFISLRQCRF